MTASINILNIVPPPQPQSAPPSPPAPQDDSQTTQGSQNTPPQTQGTTGGNTANGNTNADGNHFSKLLDTNGQGGNSPPAHTADNTGNANNAQGNNGTASSGSGASGAAGDTVGASVIVALLLSQLQGAGGAQGNAKEDVQGASSASGASSGNGSAVSNDILQLQKLLQELLQLSQQNANGAGNTSLSSGNGGSTPQVKTVSSGNGSSTDTNAAALAQVLAQMAALLQQIGGQSGGSSASGSSGIADNATTSIGAGANGNQTAALLAQLAKELSELQNAGAAGPNGADTNGANTNITAAFGASSGNGAAGGANIPTSFDAALNAQLQTALSHVNDFIAATTQGGKQGSTSSGNGSSTNVTQPQALPTPAGVQSSQDSGFLKLVSASSSPAPVADQVLVQIKNATVDSGNQIRIQLQPADLGKVVVQMNTDASGKTGVTITADNRQTLTLLQNEARSLESALRDIGLKTDTGGLSFNLSGQQNQQQNPSFGSYTQVAAATVDDDSDYYAAATAVYSLSVQQGLDIRV